jgi:hypothetical protein
LTIESTDGGAYSKPRSICIEISGDDHDIGTVLTDFIQPALAGWGFTPENIAEYFHEDYTDGDDA